MVDIMSKGGNLLLNVVKQGMSNFQSLQVLAQQMGWRIEFENTPTNLVVFIEKVDTNLRAKNVYYERPSEKF